MTEQQKKDRQRPGLDKPLRRKRKHAAWNTSVVERIMLDIEENMC